MNKILLAIDFRNDLSGVFNYTLKLAMRLDAEIILFNAFGMGEMMTREEENLKGSRTINKLKTFVEKNLPPSAKQVKFGYQVSSKFANDAIIEAAEDEKVDLLVMGIRRGEYSIDILLGSKALEVMLEIDCPVLIVPERFRTQRIRRIGCTTDFEFRDIALLNRLRKMGKRLSSDTSIHCLHVFENDENPDRMMKDMSVMKSIFEDSTNPPVEFEISMGKLVQKINAFADKQELDLLAMNSHQRGMLGRLLGGGTTEAVARGLKVPLLVFKDL